MASNCVKGMTHDTCPYNPRLGCDCGYHKPDQKAQKEKAMASEHTRTLIEKLEKRKQFINEQSSKTDSDNWDYFSGLELEEIDGRLRGLYKQLQMEEMSEWKI